MVWKDKSFSEQILQAAACYKLKIFIFIFSILILAFSKILFILIFHSTMAFQRYQIHFILAQLYWFEKLVWWIKSCTLVVGVNYFYQDGCFLVIYKLIHWPVIVFSAKSFIRLLFFSRQRLTTTFTFIM